MKGRDTAQKIKWISGAVCLIICGQLLSQSYRAVSEERGEWGKIVSRECLQDCMKTIFPLGLYLQEPLEEKNMFCMGLEIYLPMWGYLEGGNADITQVESRKIYDAALLLQSVKEETEETLQLVKEEEQTLAITAEEILPEPQVESAQVQEAAIQEEIPAQEIQKLVKKQTFSEQQLRNVEYVKKNFFTEDATTMITPQQLDYDRLMGFDATLKQGKEEPQILIYHTHSQETYIDSNPLDASTTIMGVGEYLSALLRNEYGFHVLHHLGQYDVESRDYAYTYAAKGVEKVLAENPSIEVVIDLHRDAVKEGVHLVTQIDGKETAQFMFFNGMSYTRKNGALTSLENPYIQENIAFAFQMKLAAEEYYPGLTRKTYLKGYRYNLHYRPKSLLVELGAQTNTVQEAMNACEPLAKLIDLILNPGEG